MRIVAIVACPRTGSTVLSEVLGQHPLIKSYGEVFHHDRDTRKWFHGKTPGEQYEGHASEYIHRLAAHAQDEGKKVLVFKLMDYQAGEAWNYLETNWWNVTLLHTERNPIDCLVSSVVATRTSIWHGRNEDELSTSRAVDKLELDWKELEIAFYRARALRNLTKCREWCVVPVIYEVMSRVGVEHTANAIATRILKLEPFEFHATQQKLANKPQQDRVTNMEELKARYKGTLFENWFHSCRSL